MDLQSMFSAAASLFSERDFSRYTRQPYEGRGMGHSGGHKGEMSKRVRKSRKARQLRKQQRQS